jgi:uncharacterized membrane protein YbhN (UPF0104 family)
MTHPPAAMRRSGRVLALLALSGLVVVALQHMDLARAAEQIASVRIQWLVLSIACYAAILPLWAAQWTLLSPRGPATRWRDMLGVVALTSAVLNTTPMLVGEATAVVLLVTRARLARAAALSVLAMDQLLVGVAKLALLALAASVAPLPEWMTRAVLELLAAVLLLGASLVLASWRHVDVGRALERWIPARFAGAAGAFARSLEPLRFPARGVPALGIALLKKAVEIAAIVCVHRAFGLSVPISAAIVVLAVLNLATLLPIVPGNVGVFEAAVVLALTRFGVAPEQALGVAVVQHLGYFIALALPGLLFAARSR